MVDRTSPLPAYFQISRDLRRRISSGEWKPGNKLPSELLLTKQYQVSRMTMRQAIMALVKESILTRRRGNGTFVNQSVLVFDNTHDHPAEINMESARNQQRNQVWTQLREVAQPDSRFHLDFSLFIPDFQGSDRCVSTLRESELYRSSQVLFIAPDNSLTFFRQSAIQDQKTVLVATSGLVRGFRLFLPGSVPPGQEALAATLDGMDRFSQTVSLQQIRQLGVIDLMVTGVSFVTLQGMRSGLGYGYFDLEWAIFSELGRTSEETRIIAFAHDCQVVDMQMGTSASDATANWIVTPTRMIQTSRVQLRTPRVNWSSFSLDMLERIPLLKDLSAFQQANLE